MNPRSGVGDAFKYIYTYFAFTVDLGRLAILYQHGGFYADLDTVPSTLVISIYTNEIPLIDTHTFVKKSFCTSAGLMEACTAQVRNTSYWV